MRPSYTETQAHGHIPKTPSAFATPSPSIATAINTATRSLHTELNRLIIARLPLALPSYTTTPLLYTIGISAFARIYIAFEEAWLQVLSEEVEPDTRKRMSPEVREESALLLDARIRRTNSLKRDLAHLHRVVSSRDPSEGEALGQASRALSTGFTTSSRAAIAARPHVVIAYAWVMYMALFSGGRWIRMLLKQAGPEFWGHQRQREAGIGCEDKEVQEMVSGFEFLTFAGEHDGEDIKAEFKRRLGLVEEKLSEREKLEVVEEARHIFAGCIALVAELDAVVAAGAIAGAEAEVSRVSEKEKEGRVTRQVVTVQSVQPSKTSTLLQWLFAAAMCLIMLVILAPAHRTKLLTHLAMLLPAS